MTPSWHTDGATASQIGSLLVRVYLAWGFFLELVCHGAVLMVRWLAMASW
jgi:hypothetical protein